jgi:thiosulfate/3-mercaptopyruvate sulfurtransferase
MSPVAGARPADYPRPDLLVEASELAKPEAARAFRIVDVRLREEYDAGHVPGAVWFNIARHRTAPVDDKGERAWRDLLAEKGIGPDTKVVVYDDGDVREAARLWWLLRYLGVKDVRLLNGGWPAWQAAHGPTAKEEPQVARAEGAFHREGGRLATKAFLLEHLKEKPPQIIDARSTKEFCGEAGAARRRGAIPGSVHLEWSDTIDPKSKRFKGPDQLARLFQEAGVDPNRPAVTYCQSGGRAAVMAFALELMGGKEVRNYYQSWGEWGNAEDTPVVKPPPKR